MNPLLNHLVKNKTKIISDHELSRWPTSQVEELKAGNHLKKAENSKSVYCDGCEECCPVDDYEVIDIPGKGPMCTFVCPEKDEIGFLTVSLSRRRQWRFMRPKKRKKVSKVPAKKTELKEPADVENSFFVCLDDGIAFFSEGKFRKLPFQLNSHVFKVLTRLLDGSMTSREIQEYAGSKDKPRSIVKNINSSILSRLHMVEFTHINCKKFVYYNDDNKSYQIRPLIVTLEKYKEVTGDLCENYHGV